MAIKKTVTDVKVVAELMTGIDEEGKYITKNKTLSNVKPDALDQDKFDVVNALAGLQDNDLIGIENREYASLTQGI